MRKALNVLLIFVIALHTVLWAGSVRASAATGFDPFSIICHGDPQASESESAPAGPQTRSQACDHCLLCAITPPPSLPVTALLGELAPERIIALLKPVSVSDRDSIAAASRKPRGPPQIA